MPLLRRPLRTCWRSRMARAAFELLAIPSIPRSTRDIAPTSAATALATGLSEEEIRAFFEMFAATRCVVTAFSQGVNQSAQGTDKVNAIINSVRPARGKSYACRDHA
jgi:hypothetical protein